ncbi:MAG: ferrochelatase [Raineya sp.]
MKNIEIPQKNARFGVLLVNLGTPNSPSTSDVRKYLRQFLMDGRVIDIPLIPRWLLVNLIIAPFRAPKSAKIYKEVWTENGSPLKYYGLQSEAMLQEALGEEYFVKLAMRYQEPSIDKVLEEFKGHHFEKIIVLPLFPQYASATTGSVQQAIMNVVRTWQIIPAIEFVQQFYQNPLFIKAFAKLGKKYLDTHHYDHVLFTYHGLPERQIRKGDAYDTCLKHKNTAEIGCCSVLGKHKAACYRAQCFETSRLLAKELGLTEADYTTAFQSRLGKDIWIQPYTEDIVKKFAKEGKKNILAFSPSFVADCLETTIEVGQEYKELFEKNGGEHWQLVESLNDSPEWIELLHKLVLAHTQTHIPIQKMMQVISEEKI